MPSEELKKHAEDVLTILGEDAKQPVNVDDIQGQLERFLEYGVPLDQAKQTLIKKYGGSSSVAFQTLERTKISDLESDMRSVKILAQVITINPKEITVKGEPRQIFYGILRDETGSVSFTSWHDIQVNKGDVVEIGNAYTNEWQGAVQLNIGNRTHVEQKEQDALPKEAFEPKKCAISELHTGIGPIDLRAVVLEISKKEIVVDGEQKTVFSGVLGDNTGKVPFSAWNDFKLKEKDTLSIVGGYVRSWKGLPQVSFDDKAKINILKKETISIKDVPTRIIQLHEVEQHPGMYDIQIIGRVIEIQQGSGFILRCPDCNRMIRDGVCKLHGEVDGTPDFRIKCIIDDGTGSVNTIFNRETSEQLLGKNFDELKNTDPKQLFDLMQESLFATLLKIQGNSVRDQFGTTCIPTAVERVEAKTQEEAAQIASELEGEQ